MSSEEKVEGGGMGNSSSTSQRSKVEKKTQERHSETLSRAYHYLKRLGRIGILLTLFLTCLLELASFFLYELLFISISNDEEHKGFIYQYLNFNVGETKYFAPMIVSVISGMLFLILFPFYKKENKGPIQLESFRHTALKSPARSIALVVLFGSFVHGISYTILNFLPHTEVISGVVFACLVLVCFGLIFWFGSTENKSKISVVYLLHCPSKPKRTQIRDANGTETITSVEASDFLTKIENNIESENTAGLVETLKKSSWHYLPHMITGIEDLLNRLEKDRSITIASDFTVKLVSLLSEEPSYEVKDAWNDSSIDTYHKVIGKLQTRKWSFDQKWLEIGDQAYATSKWVEKLKPELSKVECEGGLIVADISSGLRHMTTALVLLTIEPNRFLMYTYDDKNIAVFTEPSLVGKIEELHLLHT
jgi:hypothetical protein